MPERIPDEARHRAALDYIRTRTLDAAPEDDTDTDSHLHIHLHPSGEGTDLPRSTGNANPPPGRSSGNPVLVSNDAEMEDPDEEGEEGEQVIGQLPEPPEGMTYELREGPEGVDVVLCPDDGGDIQVNENDNRRSIGDARSAQILRAMNKKAKAFWTRDSVASPTRKQRIFTQHIADDERLEIRKEGDMWSLILISKSTDLTGSIPPGAEDLNEGRKNPDPEDVVGEVSAPAAGELKMERGAGRRVVDSKMTNKRLNEIHRKYWKR